MYVVVNVSLFVREFVYPLLAYWHSHLEGFGVRKGNRNEVDSPRFAGRQTLWCTRTSISESMSREPEKGSSLYSGLRLLWMNSSNSSEPLSPTS